MFVRGRVFSFPCSMQRFKSLLVFVKIILLKRDNCALALRKRLFYGVKQPFLQFQRAVFGMQDNGFHNILINKKLDNSYFCKIFLQYHSLPFVRKISSIRQKSTTPLHQWNKARASPSDRKSKKKWQMLLSNICHFSYLCVPAFILPQEHSSSGFQASCPIPSRQLERQ